jgi:hypothetical protein
MSALLIGIVNSVVVTPSSSSLAICLIEYE